MSLNQGLNADGRFFKNRSWLRLEFPELIARTEADVGLHDELRRVLMVVRTSDDTGSRMRESTRLVLDRADGQGAGNTAFPLLQHNENPDLTIWATDYSSTAVEVVKVRPSPIIS